MAAGTVFPPVGGENCPGFYFRRTFSTREWKGCEPPATKRLFCLRIRPLFIKVTTKIKFFTKKTKIRRKN
jgi:hypothetical protein